MPRPEEEVQVGSWWTPARGARQAAPPRRHSLQGPVDRFRRSSGDFDALAQFYDAIAEFVLREKYDDGREGLSHAQVGAVTVECLEVMDSVADRARSITFELGVLSLLSGLDGGYREYVDIVLPDVLDLTDLVEPHFLQAGALQVLKSLLESEPTEGRRNRFRRYVDRFWATYPSAVDAVIVGDLWGFAHGGLPRSELALRYSHERLRRRVTVYLDIERWSDDNTADAVGQVVQVIDAVAERIPGSAGEELWLELLAAAHTVAAETGIASPATSRALKAFAVYATIDRDRLSYEVGKMITDLRNEPPASGRSPLPPPPPPHQWPPPPAT